MLRCIFIKLYFQRSALILQNFFRSQNELFAFIDVQLDWTGIGHFSYISSTQQYADYSPDIVLVSRLLPFQLPSDLLHKLARNPRGCSISLQVFLILVCVDWFALIYIFCASGEVNKCSLESLRHFKVSLPFSASSVIGLVHP